MRIRWTLGIAAVVLSIQAATAGWTAFQDAEDRKALGPPENCGVQPPEPGLIESMYNSPAKAALADYYSCFKRNEKREFLRGKGELQTIVDRTTSNCQSAIRRLSPNASTLAFDYGKDFDYLAGLKGSGVDITDGGYSIKVSGSDVSGRFRVTCYTDKSFNITNVR
jgi:hypothetical protein